MVKKDRLGVPYESVVTPEYERSTQLVSRMWQHVGNTQGILLTLIEATTTNSEQCEAQKALVKREFNNMGGYIQDAVYEEYGVQEMPFEIHTNQ